MAFLNSLNIAGSALTAERFRTDIILQNLANSTTTRTENGEPYRRKQVVFEERGMTFEQNLKQELNKANSGGVRVAQVVESQNPFTPVYDPTHPHANEDGYVMMPNVNTAEEQVDLMAATRAYEANATALNVVKAMALKALEIGK
ncbi:flagellar basal body rod protein FlgC [Hydrogenoanaerobacterium sp.]|uniref:flagellar basal body rod protein FlgC n=1 Tax=Hydrogenoanaerobacterium sp. TaxID=2953763 RepID=UPI002897FE4B|nr:flagellar basal body rod protein FlgC [Hydrogenoanaerobacterium sp.]